MTVRASGLSPATGRVDFTVGNLPFGTGTVQPDGSTSVTNSVWVFGFTTITATHVTYVNGEVVTRSVTIPLTVTPR
jgi:hypothetical protein